MFNLPFPDPNNRQFYNKPKNGNYEILKNDGKTEKGEISLEKRKGGYVWVPPIPIESGYKIYMELIEDDGVTKWILQDRPEIPTKSPLPITLAEPMKLPKSDTR